MYDITSVIKAAELPKVPKNPLNTVNNLFVLSNEYLNSFSNPSSFIFGRTCFNIDFPSLKTDVDGIAINEIDKCLCINRMDIINGEPYLQCECKLLETAIMKSNIDYVYLHINLPELDLNKFEFFTISRVDVCPKTVGGISNIYDIVYLSDYIFKTIYKIYIYIVSGFNIETIYKNTFMMSIKSSSKEKGYYKIKSIYDKNYIKLLLILKIFFIKTI